MKTNLLLVVLMGMVTLCYLNHFDNSFHFDDAHTIVNNLAIRDLGGFASFFTDGTTFSSLPTNQSYRPVVTALNALDFWWGGKAHPEPLAYHVSIFISYLLSGLLLFYIIGHILVQSGYARYKRGIALFCTAWFWLHTANAETINYIIARSDSFSTFMVLLAFALYFRFPSQRKYGFYLLPVVLGFFTKEPAILFIPLLFLYKLFFEADQSVMGPFRNPRSLMPLLKQMLLSLGVAAVIVLIYLQLTPKTWTPGGVDRVLYIATQPYVIFHYFKNFLVPVNLVVDTDWTVVSSLSDPKVMGGLLFLALLLITALLTSFKRKYRPVSFGLLWFLIALAPTSLIPFAEVMNDHRTFFPYIGLFIASSVIIALVLERFPQWLHQPVRKYSLVLVAMLFLGFHAMGTYERNRIWDNEADLWKEATEKAPGNGRAWMNYGLSQMAIGAYPEAQVCFEKAIALWPNYAYAYLNMGILKSAQGDRAAAEPYFKTALQKNPGSPEPYAYYASFLLKAQRWHEAQPVIREGLALSPNHMMLRSLMAEADAGVVQDQKGVKSAEDYLQLSLDHYNAGRFEDCIQAATQSLTLKPDYDLAYNNICAASNQLKLWDKAIEAGEKGLRINPDNALLRGNLAVAYKGKSSGK